MKLKFFATAIAAVFALAASQNASAQLTDVLKGAANAAAASAVTELTGTNGNSAGSALLGLYTQYKADGNKLDLKNTKNIANIMTLAGNIKNLSQTKDKTSFLKGLIGGSKNLVNTGNQTSVLSSLTKLSGMDLSSLSAGNTSTNAQAVSALTGLLGSLKK